MTDDELERQLAAALTPPPTVPTPARVAELRARAGRVRATPEGATGDDATLRGRPAVGVPSLDQSSLDPPGSAPSDRRSRLSFALVAGIALLAAGTALGTAVGDRTGNDEADLNLLARGTPQFEASLSGSGVTVAVDGSAAPEGRIVVLESEILPVLPVGEFYELWFVAPDDTVEQPNRISAGTFHPGYDDGDTLVVLHAAVDPALFPELEITAEVADGDPAPSSDTVLRGPVDLLD